MRDVADQQLKKVVNSRTAEVALETAIARRPEPVASSARAAMAKLRKRLPGADFMVYERPKDIEIWIGSEAQNVWVFTLMFFPRWVRLYFVYGASLRDPEKLLEGSGKQGRSLKLDAGAAELDDPYVGELIEQAMEFSGVDFALGRGKLVVKSKVGSSAE